MNYSPEANFFKTIAPQIINYVSSELKNVSIVKQKSENLGEMNFVTQIDIEVEKMIVAKIKKDFSTDLILAEEEYTDTKIPEKGRIWVIDPICGTGNLGRQILLFATNIALIEDNQLVAACVVDHQQKTYYWSTRDNKIYKENELYDTSKKATGTIIEVDLFAAQTRYDKNLKIEYANFIKELYTQTDYALITYNSSFGFTYAAIGKIDGYVSPDHNLWDVAAPNFLMLQAGGTLTDINGNPWNFNARSVIAAKDPEIHKKLLKIYLESKKN